MNFAIFGQNTDLEGNELAFFCDTYASREG